jgi:hypothetical protein
VVEVERQVRVKTDMDLKDIAALVLSGFSLAVSGTALMVSIFRDKKSIKFWFVRGELKSLNRLDQQSNSPELAHLIGLVNTSRRAVCIQAVGAEYKLPLWTQIKNRIRKDPNLMTHSYFGSDEVHRALLTDYGAAKPIDPGHAVNIVIRDKVYSEDFLRAIKDEISTWRKVYAFDVDGTKYPMPRSGLRKLAKQAADDLEKFRRNHPTSSALK